MSRHKNSQLYKQNPKIIKNTECNVGLEFKGTNNCTREKEPLIRRSQNILWILDILITPKTQTQLQTSRAHHY